MEAGAEEISDIEDKNMENNETGNKRERKILNDKCRLRELSNPIKCNNSHFIGVPEEGEQEKRQNVYFSKL